MDKYIVYKTGSGLGPQSVRKSSIIEVRVRVIEVHTRKKGGAAPYVQQRVSGSITLTAGDLLYLWLRLTVFE